MNKEMKEQGIDDEICQCGHSRGYHQKHPLDAHGGVCGDEDCDCLRYLWKKFVRYVDWKKVK